MGIRGAENLGSPQKLNISLPINTYYQWIGLRENFNRKDPYLVGKSMVSGFDFPLNQSIDIITS
jgi:hypothetical protein